MELKTDQSSAYGAVTHEAIRAELDRLEASGLDGGAFLILAEAAENYMQVAPIEGGFALEIREGNEESHRVAAPKGSLVEKPLEKPKGFFARLFQSSDEPSIPVSRAECESALIAYLDVREFKSEFEWHRLFT